MGGEKLDSIGGKSENGAEWEKLTQLPKFEDRALDEMVVMKTDEEDKVSAENEPMLARMLCSMRAHWGNLEETDGVFGPNTMMHPVEYQTIAENMTWVEFAEFSDAAYDLGHKSEEDYREMLLTKGSELQRRGLFDWRSFATAVRRYNVAKHLPEIGEGDNFYCSTDLECAQLALSFGNFDGWSMNRGNEENLQKQGLSTQLLHLSYDTQTADGKMRCGIDDPRGGGSKMVTVAFNKDIIWNDDFDLATKYPTLQGVKLNAKDEVMIAQDRAVFNRLRHTDKGELAFPKIDMPITTRSEWLRRYGTQVDDASDTTSSIKQLVDDAVLKVNKAEMKEFINRFIEKIEPDALGGILREYAVDNKRAIDMAVKYFAQILGVQVLPVEYFDDKKNDLQGRHFAVGLIKLNENTMRRKPLRTLNVVAHEMFHEYQEQLRRKYEHDELKDNPRLARRAELYSFCEDHYETAFASDWAYSHQLLEREAFEFGNGVEKILKKQRTKQQKQKLRKILSKK